MIRRPPRSTLFPSRRSSDLLSGAGHGSVGALVRGDPDVVRRLRLIGPHEPPFMPSASTPSGAVEDRKSTRLNSSHVRISYAVFCLKKKKIINTSNYHHCTLQ